MARISDTAKLVGSGTGFFISAQGQILTNHHVVDGCSALRIPFTGQEIRAVHRSSDAANDLALLETDVSVTQFARFRQGRGVRRAEDVFVMGYPLRGTDLASQQMNVTKGNVSALTGPKDTFGLIQITAPVQAGNSGGPLLDTSGNIVGIVLGKANADRFAKVTGQLPENVNFAIKSATAREFLDALEVGYGTNSSTGERPPADVAADAGEFTVPVECWKSTASVDPPPSVTSTTHDQGTTPLAKDVAVPQRTLLIQDAAPTPPVSSQDFQDRSLETMLWEKAVRSGAPTDKQTYLDIYPNGAFADLARDALRPAEAENLVARSSAPSGSSDSEELFWAAIEDSTNPADFRKFLDAFPEGRFSGVASGKLAGLSPPARATKSTDSAGQSLARAVSTKVDRGPEGRDRPMGSLIEGLSAYQQGDYEKAARIWKPLAEQGDVTAQYNMGVMYARGSGVPLDRMQAHFFLSRAADRGYEGAAHMLAELKGVMTPAELEEARTQLR